MKVMLAHLGAMLGYVGPAILEQLGDKIRPKTAKIAQDGAAPRCGKISEFRFQELLQGGEGPCGHTRAISVPRPKKHPGGGVGAPTSSWRLQPGTS